jgi:lysine-specific demethylase 3
VDRWFFFSFLSVLQMNINGLNDSHKRTDISQLLNPASREAAPSFSPGELSSLGPPQAHHDQQGSPYHGAFGHPSSFHLRAASWEIQEDANKRRQDNNPARAYQHHQMEQVFYPDPTSRAARPRPGDPNNFAMDGAMWGPAHDMTNMSYNAPQLMPMYSEERTGASFSSRMLPRRRP